MKSKMLQQEAIDYGFRFARDYFHGQIVAILGDKIDKKLLREVEKVFEPPSVKRETR